MTPSEKTPEFDQYAPSYDELLEDPVRAAFARDPLYFHRRKWLLMQRLLKKAGAAPDTLRWLDVGCGRGELLTLAGGHFRQAVGCDPSSAMLSSSGPFEVRRQASPLELPFPDGSIDLVTAVCVFHHVPEESRSLLVGEILRVLARGGLCCIFEHNPWNPVTQGIVRRCPVDVDAKLLASPGAAAMLKAAGFTPVATEFFLYLPERLFYGLGWIERVLAKAPLGGQYALLAKSPA